MPTTKDDDADDENSPASAETFTKSIYRPQWFVLAQTDGAEYKPEPVSGRDEARALVALVITHIPFDMFARSVQVCVSFIAFAPKRTLFHEIAHVLLGHTEQAGTLTDDEKTPRSLAEVEAESVSLICCESLGLGEAEHSRGYIQHRIRGDTIPE